MAGKVVPFFGGATNQVAQPSAPAAAAAVIERAAPVAEAPAAVATPPVAESKTDTKPEAKSKPRVRARKVNGQFLPAPESKPPENAEQLMADIEAQESKGKAEIQEWMDKKNGITRTVADKTQIIDGGDVSKVEEPVTEAPAAEAKPADETAVDETLKARAISAGFKAEELAGLSKDDVEKQVILRDRWIAEQGAKLATNGETKPVETKVEAPVKPVEKKPEVQVPSEFKIEWEKDATGQTIVHEEVIKQVEALHKYHEKQRAEQQTKFDKVLEYLDKQEQAKVAVEVEGYFAGLPNKDAFAIKPLAQLDPKQPKDKLTLDVLQTAAGMEVYFAQHGQAVPSRKELIERAAAAVTSINPSKPKPPAATATARATSRVAPPTAQTTQDAYNDIQEFYRQRGRP